MAALDSGMNFLCQGSFKIILEKNIFGWKEAGSGSK